MKFVTYRAPDGRTLPGVLEGAAIRTIGTPTLLEYIALAPHERIAWHTGDDLVPLGDVALDAPCIRRATCSASDATIWNTPARVLARSAAS